MKNSQPSILSNLDHLNSSMGLSMIRKRKIPLMSGIINNNNKSNDQVVIKDFFARKSSFQLSKKNNHKLYNLGKNFYN